MSDIRLEYASSATLLPRGRAAGWWFAIGPGIGALLGFVQAITYFLLLHFLQGPDMYEMLALASFSIMFCGLGIVIGFVWGVIMYIYERVSRRRARPMRVARWMVLLMFMMAGVCGFALFKYEPVHFGLVILIFLPNAVVSAVGLWLSIKWTSVMDGPPVATIHYQP